KNPTWKIETMPAPRVMGDMLVLPTGDLLIINGAKSGCSGWEFAEDPNLNPVLYRPTKAMEQRFEELEASEIPRMYHSTSAVLPDGKILVAGSSTHNGYKFDVKYPTELRVEKFSPPYLDPQLAVYKPTIETNFAGQELRYGNKFSLEITLNGYEVVDADLKVTMYSPAITTHGYSMNQRLIVLATSKVSRLMGRTYQLTVTAPPNGAVAPPGYYMLFVVNRGVPSISVWVNLR
ncbi:galactose oxidase-like domain-containing protein, partial [Ralstonia pseudosolanacearum]|uniref:DUF1929 domain-containing protein n=1 Tax=Ralstonia pseudosolanacearum TaxID=1310165 RepID=UPI003CF82449